MKKWQAYQVMASTDVYVASDVDAKLKEYDEDNLLLSQAASLLSDRCNSLETVIEAQRQRQRIAEMEKAIRFYADAHDFYMYDSNGNYHDDGNAVARAVFISE